MALRYPLPIYLTGPTGSGKSAVALRLAERTGGEIICADAYQVYREIPILTAQPTRAELQAVPHHLYGSVPVSAEMDAGTFEKLALAAIHEVQDKGKLPLVCGGSGLYLKALTHGLSPLPPGDPDLRQELEALPIAELSSRLLSLDPGSEAQINLQNPRHVVRALEICLLTGEPASKLKQSWAMPRSGIRGVYFDPPREELYQRINVRTKVMVEKGVIAEAGAVDPDSLSATAGKAIGLWEFRAVAEESLSVQEAIASVQQATRNYAKRQCTWFRKETSFVNLPVTANESAGITAEKIARIFGLEPKFV